MILAGDYEDFLTVGGLTISQSYDMLAKITIRTEVSK